MINAAIVGLGRWGRLLVDSVQGSSELIRFSHGATRTRANAETYCAANDIALLNDLDAVLAEPSIDAVVLATPHTQHAEQIIAAAHAGKHVLCEKPFTLTTDEADAALAAVRDAGTVIAVGHNRRWSANTMALKAMIDQGKLGRMLAIEGNFSADLSGNGETWRAEPAESPGGGLTSLGIHVIDAFIHLFGRIREVQARSRRLILPFDVDDTTGALLTFEDGCIGTLTTLAASPLHYSVRVFGTEGWAALGDADRLDWAGHDCEIHAHHYAGYGYPSLRTMTGELEAFADAISGVAPFPIPPEEIRHSVAVMAAILASIDREGAVVPVG